MSKKERTDIFVDSAFKVMNLIVVFFALMFISAFAFAFALDAGNLWFSVYAVIVLGVSLCSFLLITNMFFAYRMMYIAGVIGDMRREVAKKCP